MYPEKQYDQKEQWIHDTQLKMKRCITHISTKNAISSNLLTIDLEHASLCGVDKLKGPTINLEFYSVAELTNKLNDMLMCHEHLKAIGLIPHDRQPILRLDICYE